LAEQSAIRPPRDGVDGDRALAALLRAHSGLTPAESAALDRRMVLALARVLDDPAMVEEAVCSARRSLPPAEATVAQTRPILHGSARSSATYRVRIALGLKGMAADTRTVALDRGAQREAPYLALNPQGLVPVLEIDGLVLRQSLAIIAYLDQTRPEPALLPAEPGEKARLTALAHVIAMETAPLCNQSVATHAAALSGGGEAAKAAWVHRYMLRGLTAAEALLDHQATGPFAHGDRPGLADCCIVPQLYNARRFGIDLGPMPRLRAIDRACATLPAFARAHPDALADTDKDQHP
jgi:maleylacetoacetate isomerase